MINRLLSRKRALARNVEAAVQVRVELIYDEESHNWAFRVPSLRIVGGADTKEQAIAEAMQAVLFALEAPPQDIRPNGEVAYIAASLSGPRTAALA